LDFVEYQWLLVDLRKEASMEGTQGRKRKCLIEEIISRRHLPAAKRRTLLPFSWYDYEQ
jgi:hypothetical protein